MLVVLWGQFSGPDTQSHPFARIQIAPGQDITEDLVEYRQVPTGLLQPVTLPSPASFALEAGDPILPSHLGEEVAIPENWWALEVSVPSPTQPGTRVQLIATDYDNNPLVIPGLVISTEIGNNSFSESSRALVAIPQESVAEASAAAAQQRLTVVVDASAIG